MVEPTPNPHGIMAPSPQISFTSAIMLEVGYTVKTGEQLPVFKTERIEIHTRLAGRTPESRESVNPLHTYNITAVLSTLFWESCFVSA